MAAGAALAGALLLPAAALANETHVYGIASFGGAGQCNADSHSVHTKTAAVVANYFNNLKNNGLCSDVQTLNNSSARADLWTDAAKSATQAKDTLANAGVDDADVFFVHTHGGHNESPARSWIVMGSNVDSCSAVTDTHMRLGNGKLNIAVVKACQSGNIEVWENGAFIKSEDNGVVGAPTLHRHKTFVLRAINGIRVEGHRAVVTHGVDGGFQRALISWPPLARAGHLLHTRLTTAEIEQRAREALLLEGESGGPVLLFWKYEPTQVSTGEWVLTLQVGASMPSLTGADSTEEPRVVDVDVSPVP